jgi:hypothetical protein
MTKVEKPPMPENNLNKKLPRDNKKVGSFMRRDKRKNTKQKPEVPAGKI